MKNTLLFFAIALSLNAFAQNNGAIARSQFPLSNSEHNVRHQMDDERLKTSVIFSEKIPGQIDKDQTQEKKWSFSLFGGFSLLGPGENFKNKMQESGFGDRRPGYDSWLGYVDSKDYPINKTGMIWNFETRYNVSKKWALNLTAGKINHSLVNGLDESNGPAWGPYRNYLRIENDLWAASCNYVWRTGKRNDGISLGPVIARHKISVDTPFDFQDDSSTSSSIIAGFNLGYAHAFVQKKNWFLNFKATYTWLPDIEIGPYTSESQGHTSVFKEIHVRLSTLNFGIATGWRW